MNTEYNDLLNAMIVGYRLNNDTYDADQRKALSYEVQQVADGLLASANQVNGQGDYLFAGYRNDVIPFVKGANGEVSYQGSQDEKNIPLNLTNSESYSR